MDFSDLPWTALLITIVGAVAIVALALVIAVLESRSQQQAWLHIADARRINQDRSRVLDVRESEQDELLDLLEELDGLPLCPECTRLLTRTSEEDRGIAR
jgi:hypothetical protein